MTENEGKKTWIALYDLLNDLRQTEAAMRERAVEVERASVALHKVEERAWGIQDQILKLVNSTLTEGDSGVES
jgi:hypothetical protein